MQDKIIAEVRRVREEIGARNGFDVRKIVRDIEERAPQAKEAAKPVRQARRSAKGSA